MNGYGYAFWWFQSMSVFWISEMYSSGAWSFCSRGKSGTEVIKLFSCSNQLGMKFFLLINVKMPIIVGILTFMSGKNSILDLPEPKKSRISWYFYTYERLEFHAQLSWAWKKFYNLGAKSHYNNISGFWGGLPCYSIVHLEDLSYSSR